MSLLELITLPEGKSLPLSSETKVTLVKRFNALLDSSKGEATISLPFTLKDDRETDDLLKRLSSCTEATQINGYFASGGKVLQKIERLKLIAKKTDCQATDFQAISSDKDWFNKLSGLSFCDLIDYEDSNHTYTQDFIESTWDRDGESGHLIAYPVAKYGDTLKAKPGFFMMEHLKRVFKSIGYDFSLKGGKANSDKIKNLFVPFYNGTLKSTRQNLCGISVWNGSPAFGDNQSYADNGLFLPFDSVIQYPTITFFDDTEDTLPNFPQDCWTEALAYLNDPCFNFDLDANPPEYFYPELVYGPLNNTDNYVLFPATAEDCDDISEEAFLGPTPLAPLEGNFRITFIAYHKIYEKVPCLTAGVGYRGKPRLYECYFSKEKFLKCGDPFFDLFYSYQFEKDFPENQANHLSITFDGETKQLFNWSDWQRGLQDIPFFNGQVQDFYYGHSDTPENLRPQLSIGVKIESVGDLGVCEGDVVDMSLNCLDMPITDFIDYLESLGFIFDVDTDNGTACLIHVDDFYGNDYGLYANALDWTGKQKCAAVTASPNREQDSISNCRQYQYQSDEEIGVQGYLFQNQEIEGFGWGTYKSGNANLKDEVTEANSQNAFASTYMETITYQGQTLIVPCIGGEENEKTTPRILVWKGRYLPQGASGAPYGYAFFYDESLDCSLMFGNDFGTGLIDSCLSRYLEWIACSENVETTVCLDVCDWSDIKGKRAVKLKDRKGNVFYHLLQEIDLAFPLDVEGDAQVKALKLINN